LILFDAVVGLDFAPLLTFSGNNATRNGLKQKQNEIDGREKQLTFRSIALTVEDR
jgi:hypothetical protein